jgi:signal transduction histidine kinase
MRTLAGTARHPGLGLYAVLQWIGLAIFVAGVYVVVVRGVGALVGRTESPSVLLSVLATTVVALSFARVQATLDGWLRRWEGGHATAPYDVLSQYSDSVATEGHDEDLLVRMARLLAEGTGAQWAQVWVMVSARLTLAATWPTDADHTGTAPLPGPGARDGSAPGRRALAVEHGGEPLGILRLQERVDLPLSGVEERLFAALADRSGLMLRLLGVRADLELRHDELVERAGELRASRERLIAAQDSERSRLERDLHDGAQQHLVALTVNLRLVQGLPAGSADKARELLARQADAATVAIETLSSLSRGIYPRLLSEAGLLAALRSAVATSAIPVTITAGEVARLPAPVEAALYFCCMEAVQNAAKHSRASGVRVELSCDDAEWSLVISDDGVGFSPSSSDTTGAGLANMRDRLDAVGGTVTVASLVGTGTTVSASVSARAA